ncbi:MAG TPA: hypothetical protein VNS19_09030 [Acidimicrobiales bacterium]|nr:hypothetical protein [Acidimicrobiales bacterium]
MQPSDSPYRSHDLLDSEQAVKEFPALSLRHLKRLRDTNTIRYSIVRRKAYYRWSDLDDYVTSCVVGGGR